MERGSVAMSWFKLVQPVSDVLWSQVRLARAIMRLWRRLVVHSHFVGASQAVGRSIKVGIKIFSIVGCLSFLTGLFRGFGLWLLGGPGLR